MKTTPELIKKVKAIMDRADWTFQYSGSHGKDVETACAYLGGQLFSEKSIKARLDDVDPDDLSYHIESMDIDVDDTDTLARLCVSLIMDDMAWDRISKYLWIDRFRSTPGMWSIDESVSFHICGL